jgi:hypothetical protein
MPETPDRRQRRIQFGGLCQTRSRHAEFKLTLDFMFVYNVGRAIGAEQPEGFAYFALEFFERRDLFLVSRESGMVFP